MFVPLPPRPASQDPPFSPLVFVPLRTIPNGERGLARSPIPEAGREEGGAKGRPREKGKEGGEEGLRIMTHRPERVTRGQPSCRRKPSGMTMLQDGLEGDRMIERML